eukprot:TRINITY_DN1072_c0_g1_i2.p1 TRINITY_DN1072_c0_g1~~TRINITY_DN1072_c0_g1_i2.p1  ORF type:complete len:192 (-),score=34.62 TRINITY_DN1072_c0_g1_i2:55-630(-)
MWIFDWFWGVLASWGLANKSGKIVFLGLDNAGKTTLLHLLRDDRVVQHMPTQKPTMEELSVGNIKFSTYDLGGHEIARRLWRDYYAQVNAVVFMVDLAARERFEESKVELDELLADPDLKEIPFLVLANKIDIPGAASEEELRSALALYNTYGKQIGGTRTPGVRPIEVFTCSVVKRMGVKEGFNWVAQFI